MKLMLRPEWRLRPLSSFLGVLDIKTGVIIALLFALLNKVAGVYGLIALLTGAGGSAAQLTLYIYSLLVLVALGWALHAVKQEDAKNTLYFAHLFFADHILSTVWTVFFAVIWFLFTPHDGRRQASSPAQEDIMKSVPNHRNMTEDERMTAALTIWNKEKGPALSIIIIGWLVKFYFVFLLYSYATHLRKGSYRSLPHSRPNAASTSHNATAYDPLNEEDDEIEDFYRLPVRSPRTAGGSSISSFADFITAPGRGKRSKDTTVIATKSPNPVTKPFIGSNGDANDDDMEDEVLFEDDELAGTSSGHHSKFGSTTEDSGTSVTSSPSDEDRERGEGRHARNYSPATPLRRS